VRFSRPQAPKRILEGHFTAAFGHSLALKDLAKKSNWVSFSLSIGKKKTPKKKEEKKLDCYPSVYGSGQTKGDKKCLHSTRNAAQECCNSIAVDSGEATKLRTIWVAASVAMASSGNCFVEI
jgi:hypothetical protein